MAAVAVYVPETPPALLFAAEADPEMAERVPRGPTIFTVDIAAAAALQPEACTLKVAAPVNPLFHVTVPDVPEPLTVPAEEGLIDHTYPVALLAVPVV